MIIMWRDIGATRATAIIVGAFIILVAVSVIFLVVPAADIDYSNLNQEILLPNPSSEIKPIYQVSHIKTPESLRAIYITACTASGKKSRDKILATIDGTEINAIVIDIKDYSGTLAYASSTVQPKISSAENNQGESKDYYVKKYPGNGCRIYDLPEFIRELHQKKIYAIARITVFQDPLFSRIYPSVAVKNKDNPQTVWRDYKGLSYIDPGAPEYWDFVVDIGREAYEIGFDELNFDYIRFPSDGEMANVFYTWSEGRDRSEVLREFFLYLREQFASTGVPMSADLFGLTTSATGDLGIGQVLEDVLMYFDYVSPMVYPSHYAYNFNGLARPAQYPYEVVRYAMDEGVKKAVNASSTPTKLRPWLQAFNLGAEYTPAMVRRQVKATYDAGLNSYMLWNSASNYDRQALFPDVQIATTTAPTTPI